jgi:hypothetical protein
MSAAPEGGQVAYLYGRSGATMSQAIAGFQGGVPYTLNFSAAQRRYSNTGGQDFDIYLDSTLLCAFFSALGLVSIYAMNAEKPQPRADTQAEAQRLWELAIAAKGGRERLYAMRNMIISTNGSKYHSVELHVFPNKFWRWTGEPEPFGQSANMYNLGQRVAYTSDSGRPGAAVKLHESNLGGGHIELVDAQLLYLMETRWVKPTLVGFQVEKLTGIAQTWCGHALRAGQWTST